MSKHFVQLKKVSLPSREVSIIDHVNVLVIGGGPAGIGAAYGAVKSGATTAIVERYGFLGGMATTALVGPFMPCFSGDGSKRLIGGAFEELVGRLVDKGGAIDPTNLWGGTPETSYWIQGHHHVTPFDSEILKLVADEFMCELGVGLHYHSYFVEPIMEENRINGVIIVNKSGLQAITADYVIDCTADADVAFGAGVPCEKGRKSDGLMQPMSMFFQVGGVLDAEFIEFIEAHPEEKTPFLLNTIKLAKKNGDFTLDRWQVGLYRSISSGIWRVNTTRIIGLDGTNASDLTKAEIVGRKQVFEVFNFFKKYLPGFQNALLLNSGAQIGVRETRRIIGEYILQSDDLVNATQFYDVIAMSGNPIDLHSPTGGSGVAFSPTSSEYEIPFRSLIPKNIDGLLVAGRCISATHEGAAAIRVMPTCYATGQAAGAGASACLRQEVEPRYVDVTKVQNLLRHQNVILPERVMSKVQ